MKKLICDLVYPKNSYYITEDPVFNPNVAFSGTWVQLDGGYALVTTKKRAGVGFEMKTTYADNHQPGQAIMGGVPNVTGSFQLTDDNDTQYPMRVNSTSGAFYGNTESKNLISGYGSSRQTAVSTAMFDASRSSVVYGLYQEGSSVGRVIPDHIAVIVWKRTA